MFSLTEEQLATIKRTKLVGSLGLTPKPVLPNIVLFANRPKEFLDELRRLRETMAFKAGPSKRRIASLGTEEEQNGEGAEGEAANAGTGEGGRSRSKSKQTNRGSSAVADAAKLASSGLDTSQQANMLAALNAVLGPRRRKK